MELDIFDCCTNPDDGEVDLDAAEMMLTNLIGKHPYYLVFAKGCRYNGASGYKFCNNIIDTFMRDYESNIIIVDNTKNAIKCRESSHDVPMGSDTYIIGLTRSEYEHYEDADFTEIEQFALSKF